jgi:hypothetical protein
MGFSSINANAEESAVISQQEALAKVKVVLDIFPLEGILTIDDYPKILEDNKPENSFGFTVLAGEPSSVEIGNEEMKWNASGTTQIKFATDKEANIFNLEFEITRGRTNNIGSATDMEVGKVMLMSANLDNITKLIRVTTTRQAKALVSNTGLDANQNYCATISVNKNITNREERPLRYITHNGEDLTFRSINSRYTLARSKTLKIKPGLHHFTATASCISLNKSKQRKKAISASAKRWCFAASSKEKKDKEFHGEFAFSINVEAGKKYHLVAQRKMLSETELEDKLSAKISKVTNESCSLNDYEENVKATRLNR